MGAVVKNEGVQATDFRPDINALRAFAVLAVVAYHYGVPGFAGGFAGVDIFFVISGFLITSQILEGHVRGDFSFRNFYLSRLRRIFPALAVVCVASLLWGWRYVLPYDYLVTTRHALAALFFLSNFAFTGERGYFDIAAHAKPMLHTWSLSVEGQFYIFLPVGIGLAWRFARRHVVGLTIGAFLLSLAWCLYEGRVDSGDAFYKLSARSWEFLAGSLLAMQRLAKPKIIVANTGSVLSLGVLIASFVILNSSLRWPGYWTLLPVAAAVALIAMRDAPLTRPLLASWPLQRLGDLSYSLYLWHWPVLVFAKQYVLTMERELSAVELGGLFLLSLLMAILSWRLVEQPIRSRRGWWTERRLWTGVASVLTVVLCFSLLIVGTKGAPKRLPDYVQRASAAVFVNTPRDECFRRSDSTKDAPEQFCSFGKDAGDSPKLVLWGDSHANQYLTSVSEAATAAGLNGVIATQAACRSTLAGQPTGLVPDESAGCERFNIEVNRFIEQSASVRGVIIGRLWKPDDTGGFDRTVDLVKHLVKSGKTVVLVGPLPELQFNVLERWSRQQIRIGHAIDFMSVPLASQRPMLAMREKLRAELSEQIQRGKVVLIDPFQRLCDATECRLVENGVSYFRDTSHLSQMGSILFTPDFLAALKTIEN